MPYVPGRLFEIQFEWLSRRTYTEKVHNIRGTGTGLRAQGNTFLVHGTTVIDDANSDLVFGQGDVDLLFADLPEDTIDLVEREVLVEI